MQKQYFDVVIAGGGIIGCSSAYYLIRHNPELDLSTFSPERLLENRPLTETSLV